MREKTDRQGPTEQIDLQLLLTANNRVHKHVNPFEAVVHRSDYLKAVKSRLDLSR